MRDYDFTHYLKNAPREFEISFRPAYKSSQGRFQMNMNKRYLNGLVAMVALIGSMMGSVMAVPAQAGVMRNMSSGRLAAEGLDLETYLSIGSVRVEAEDEEVLSTPAPEKGLKPNGSGDIRMDGPTDALGELNEANLILDQIINMGKKIWVIVEANKPVVNVTTQTANALPTGASSWQALQGWQTPQAKTFRVVYENLYGMDVVDFKFRVLFTAGGNVKGKGLYITDATILPANLDVSWGYKFNATGSVSSVTNAGTSADPIGAMQLVMTWTVNTVLKHSESTENFYVRGDGLFKQL